MACVFIRNRCGMTGFTGCRCPPEARALAESENLEEFRSRVADLRFRIDLLDQDADFLLNLSGPLDPRRSSMQDRIYRSIESVREGLRRLEGEFGRSGS